MEKEALLEVRSLSVRYPGNKKEVLHQVDLTLVPGAITCVIGESGSGKSTLLQAVLQLPGKVEITGGDVSFRGQRLQTMPEAKRRIIRGQDVRMPPRSADSSESHNRRRHCTDSV